MKRLLRIGLVLLLAASLPACIIIDDDDPPPGFDFNGVWTFAMTGCQAQVGDVVITQGGADFLMTTSTLAWTGVCDPFAANFTATASGPWGYWTIQGTAIGPDQMRGSYLYVEHRRGQCTGSFDATRVAFLSAGEAGRPELRRAE